MHMKITLLDATCDYWIMVCGLARAGKDLIETVGDVRQVAITNLYPHSETSFELAPLTTLNECDVYLAMPAEPIRGRLWMTMPNLMGFVVMIDATSRLPEMLEEVAHLIEELHTHARKPYLIAANQSAISDTVSSPEELRDALDLDEDVPIVPCDATDPQSVKDLLIELTYKMIG